MIRYIKLVLLEIAIFWTNIKSRRYERHFVDAKEGSLIEEFYGSKHVEYWKIREHLRKLLSIHLDEKFKK